MCPFTLKIIISALQPGIWTNHKIQNSKCTKTKEGHNDEDCFQETKGTVNTDISLAKSRTSFIKILQNDTKQCLDRQFKFSWTVVHQKDIW